ncbi:hypothetical protein GCM10009863_68060 [Streptomyces axinellae]|uniref:Uncharacterized protein n=1 Tax=Streptomyces axinellae TaxID=552788 RepID=A0ABN3R2C9_9ACTN
MNSSTRPSGTPFPYDYAYAPGTGSTPRASRAVGARQRPAVPLDRGRGWDQAVPAGAYTCEADCGFCCIRWPKEVC